MILHHQSMLWESILRVNLETVTFSHIIMQLKKNRKKIFHLGYIIVIHGYCYFEVRNSAIKNIVCVVGMLFLGMFITFNICGIFQHITAQNMQECGFLLIRIFPYKNRIYDSVLIRENTSQGKPIFWDILHSVCPI